MSIALSTQLSGPYARIALLRPHDGDTVDFEAGYIRHLEWHRQAKDTWTWFGWTIWAGDRQRWFVYATFGHTAAAGTAGCVGRSAFGTSCDALADHGFERRNAPEI